MPCGKRLCWTVVLGLLTPMMAAGQEGGGYYRQAPDTYVTRRAPDDFYRADVREIRYEKFEKEYAESLRFDPVYGAADSQRVNWRSGRLDGGKWSVIEPEEGAWALDSNQLAEGRVIARIKSDTVYKQLGYGRRWTYWWVDKRGQRGWRSVFFSADLPSAVETDLTHHTYPYHTWRQSAARWRGSQWGTCDKVSCCMKQ